MEQPNTTAEQNTVNPQEALVKAASAVTETEQALALLEYAHGFLSGLSDGLDHQGLQTLLTLATIVRSQEYENHQKALQNLREVLKSIPLTQSPTEETPEEG